MFETKYLGINKMEAVEVLNQQDFLSTDGTTWRKDAESTFWVMRTAVLADGMLVLIVPAPLSTPDGERLVETEDVSIPHYEVAGKLFTSWEVEVARKTVSQAAARHAEELSKFLENI